MKLFLRHHIVKKGETLEQIAAFYNVPNVEILKYYHYQNVPKDSNHLGHTLFEGQEIFVPESYDIEQIWSYNDFNPINYFNTGLQLQEGIENYHNFITADFNFDDLEDFAILYDSGGNGGPVYSYYFQNKKGEFKELKDFPLNEGSFPKEINKKDNTLTISGPIGCCKIETTIFQLKNSKWNIISSKQKNMSKN